MVWLSSFEEKLVERKERLVQTYIVVYGLIVTGGHGINVPENINSLFVVFLFGILSYYVCLDTLCQTHKHKNVISYHLLSFLHYRLLFLFTIITNLFALLSSCCLSWSIVSMIESVNGLFDWFIFLCLSVIMTISLLIPYPDKKKVN